MSAALLELDRVTLRAGKRTLVRGLSVSIAAGQLWCLLGPNGAGKSTLLHTAVGLRPPDGGAIRMAGRALRDWPMAELARLRGFLPQSQHDTFSASVLDHALLGRHPYLGRWQWEDERDCGIARAALAQVDLAGFEQRDVLTLSGGERQRVALAMLLAQDPPLLLLDEPVSHLDLHHQIAILEHVSRLAREQSKAAVFTVYDLNLAARYATHALLLLPDGDSRQGPIAEVMCEESLARAFGHRVVRVPAAGRALFIPE